MSKDIETITCYNAISPSLIHATQRTATYFNYNDPRYNKLFQINNKIINQAVDIRLYDCMYVKVR